MKPKIVIIDYGLGNLLSVKKAFENIGAEVEVTDNLKRIVDADRLVLPGVGEVLLTSIDNEGTRKGFELELIESVSKVLKVPLIVSGGMGKPDDLVQAVEMGADAIAIADILHYNWYSLS